MTLHELTQTHITLPEGFTIRPACLDDAEAISTLREVVESAMGNPDRVNPDDVRAEWMDPHFNLAESSRVIISPEGQIIGSVIVVATRKPPVRPHIIWFVHPEYEDHDFGLYLLQWGEQQARQVIDRCPAEARVTFLCKTIAGYVPRDCVLAALHMTHIRDNYRMLIEMEDAPPVPQFPTGIHVRTYDRQNEIEAVLRASNDCFRDHWGYVEQPFEYMLAHWQHWIEADKRFDETLWFLAVDDETDEIAGICLCRCEDREDPNAGYVDELGVRPAYRKRGLGLALLHHAFGEFWKRGQPRVSLGVDASSLTGAVRLYERAGMYVHRQWAIYEKELRSGVDISTTHIE